VGTIYDPRELPGVSTAGPGIGRGVTHAEDQVVEYQKLTVAPLSRLAPGSRVVEWVERKREREGEQWKLEWWRWWVWWKWWMALEQRELVRWEVE
jgi:hypothetical protein